MDGTPSDAAAALWHDGKAQMIEDRRRRAVRARRTAIVLAIVALGFYFGIMIVVGFK